MHGFVFDHASSRLKIEGFIIIIVIKLILIIRSFLLSQYIDHTETSYFLENVNWCDILQVKINI